MCLWCAHHAEDSLFSHYQQFPTSLKCCQGSNSCINVCTPSRELDSTLLSWLIVLTSVQKRARTVFLCVRNLSPWGPWSQMKWMMSSCLQRHAVGASWKHVRGGMWEVRQVCMLCTTVLYIYMESTSPIYRWMKTKKWSTSMMETTLSRCSKDSGWKHFLKAQVHNQQPQQLYRVHFVQGRKTEYLSNVGWVGNSHFPFLVWEHNGWFWPSWTRRESSKMGKSSILL